MIILQFKAFVMTKLLEFGPFSPTFSSCGRYGFVDSANFYSRDSQSFTTFVGEILSLFLFLFGEVDWKKNSFGDVDHNSIPKAPFRDLFFLVPKNPKMDFLGLTNVRLVGS